MSHKVWPLSTNRPLRQVSCAWCSQLCCSSRSARNSELLAFGDDQGRTDGGGQAVENVGTQGSVSRQEITELLSRDSRLGGEVRDQPPAAVNRLAELATKRRLLLGLVNSFQLRLKQRTLGGDLFALLLQSSLLLSGELEVDGALGGRHGMFSTVRVSVIHRDAALRRPSPAARSGRQFPRTRK